MKKNSLQRTLVPVFACTLLFSAVEANAVKTSMTNDASSVLQTGKHQVKGRVVDGSGEAVIGATVMEKGTTNGTVTDFDGNFSIQVGDGAQLEISYIGYKTVTLLAKPGTDMNITITEDSEMLEDVVVVGYGTMKKKDLTGAVGSIKGDDLSSRRTTQLSTALQGAVSGVTVTRGSGDPGSGTSIRVRGITTMGDSSPLVIVDGVPGDINQVNPDDVENMTV